jgi:hypothetical protein
MSAIRTCTLANVFLSMFAVACGGEPPPQPPPAPQPAVEPPPAPPPPTASTPAPKPEAPWTTLVDFAQLPGPRAAKPEDKKLFALVTDIKKAHKECGAATPTVTSQSPSQGAFTAKGVKETAYIVEWDCNGNVKGTKTSKPDLVFHRLVIANEKGEKLTREVDVPEKMLVGMSDVDADGDNELVLVTGGGNIEARLVELADAPAGQLAPIFTWSSLGNADCVDGQQDVPKLLYRMTDAPEYKADRAKRLCQAPAPPTPPAPPAKK